MLTSRFAGHVRSHLIFTNTFEIVTINFLNLQTIKVSHTALTQTSQLAKGGTGFGTQAGSRTWKHNVILPPNTAQTLVRNAEIISPSGCRFLKA